jgi:hypothetical protein
VFAAKMKDDHAAALAAQEADLQKQNMVRYVDSNTSCEL